MFLVDVKIALRSLRATKVRTALTTLGIVIGVASVTVVMSLGEGAKQMIRDQVQQLGSNLLTIRPGRAVRDRSGNVIGYDVLAALSASTLSEHDVMTVQQNPNVSLAAPIMAVNGSVSASASQNPASSTAIIATSSQLDKILGLKVRSGEFVSDLIDRNTAVLGQDLAVDLFGSDTAIGRKVLIRGQEFTVIGILDHYAQQTNFSTVYNYNRAVFIPLDAGKAFNQGIAQIQQINARVASGHDVTAAANDVRQALLKNHGNEEDFTVLRPEESLSITDNLLRLITTITSAVASISLIVGGIGIMNIMLVSVTERTREIGIRKAVGATNAKILRQFLIEALVMCVTGGFIGVVLAYIVAVFIGANFSFLPVITWQIVLVAVGVATVIGTVFGIAPALKAAYKDPIEALRFFN